MLKQNKCKARKSVDTMDSNLDGDVSFTKFVTMFDILLYFYAQVTDIYPGLPYHTYF